MKKHFCNIVCIALILLSQACSKDDDPGNNEVDINHLGEKWTISSVEYNIIDQSLTSASVKSGTQADAGAFYFDGVKGSFDIKVDKFHKEDVFGYEFNNTNVSITSITQSVSGSTISQYVTALSGDKNTATTMTLDGTITRQSLTGQFVMTGTFQLVKQ